MSDSTPTSPTELALGALTTAAWVAVPDYVSRPWPRRAVRLAIVAATTGAYVLLDRRPLDEIADDGADVVESPHALALAAGVVGSLASARGSKRLTAAVVRRLEARGVRRPWTVVGIGLAAVTVGLRAADPRGRVLRRE